MSSLSEVTTHSVLLAYITGMGVSLSDMSAGKTICINHFLINDSWYLVDLPGYGWVPQPPSTMRSTSRDNQSLCNDSMRALL